MTKMTIEELKESIDSLNDFIDLAETKLDKLSNMIIFSKLSRTDETVVKKEIRELCTEYCRISGLIDEARVDIEDLELQIERMKKSESKNDIPGIKVCHLVIELKK